MTPSLLSALRAYIQRDRVALAYCHRSPVDGTLDADGQAGVDEADALIARIDTAACQSRITATRLIDAWESSPLRSHDGRLFDAVADLAQSHGINLTETAQK